MTSLMWIMVPAALAICSVASASAGGRATLENTHLKVEVDARRPLVRSYELIESGVKMQGTVGEADSAGVFCADTYRSGQPVQVDIRPLSSGGDATSRHYDYAGFHGSDKAFTFTLRMSLRDSALHIQLGDIREHPGFELREIRFSKYRPLSLSAGPHAVLAIDNDLKRIGSLEPQTWSHQPFALLADSGVSAGVWCNQIDPGGPLEVTVTDTGSTKAASVGPLVFRHRVKDRVMPDFEMRIGILGDYNGDGEADWLDAANWIGAQIPAAMPDFYTRSHVYKAFMCDNNNVRFSIDQMRERMVQLHNLTNGSPHIIYLVGWQYDGHDSEYPAMDRVNEAIGGRDKLLALMRDGAKYNFNISFHFNFDDAYITSPDWDPSVIAVDDKGDLVKGGVWSGNQCYIISPYKLVKSGKAARMVDRLVELYPLRDTIHLDVLSAVPNRVSLDKDDPSDEIANLVLGKFEIMRLFKNAGLDVSSEWITYPFVGPMTDYWHAGFARPGNYPINTAILHGRVLYGGWYSGWQGAEANYIAEYLAYGATMDMDLVYASPLETLLDVEFLLDSVEMMYNRRPMTGFIRRGSVVRVDYGRGTWVEWNEHTGAYEVHVDGRLVAKDYACMVPSSNGAYIVYSRDARTVSFPLPDALKGSALKVLELTAHGDRKAAPYELRDGELSIDAAAHSPYLVVPVPD